MSRTTPSCREAVRRICADLGRDLDAPECRPVRQHVRRCPSCRAWLRTLEATVGLYRAYPVPSRPRRPARTRRRRPHP